MATTLGAGLSLALIVFSVILLICWIVLPFALIGTKPLLSKLLKEQERTNLLLQALYDRGERSALGSNTPAEHSSAPPTPSGARRKGWE